MLDVSLQVTVFAVGVGGNIYKEELRAIASAPKCSHVYLLEAFSDIAAFASQIMYGACEGEKAKVWRYKVYPDVRGSPNFYENFPEINVYLSPYVVLVISPKY